MWKDPIVEEIRKHRDEYAKKFNYDLSAIFDDLRKKEAADPRAKLVWPYPPANVNAVAERKARYTTR